jgi:serine acetyltransferase
VTKDVLAHTVVAGVPARPIKDIDDIGTGPRDREIYYDKLEMNV